MSNTRVNAPIVISEADAKRHDLPPLSIRVDLAAAGMYARPFPAKDHYLILNGPPGAPIAVVVWNCTSLPDDDEAVIRARFVPPWARELELGAEDRGVLLGAEHTGRLFATGSGQTRACWFGVRAQRGATKVLVALSVGGHDGSSFTAADVLDNAMIHAVVATLRIE